MSLLRVHDGPRAADAVAFIAGVKAAADGATVSYALSGALYLSKTGWLLLSVPNAFARGVFAALDEHGLELPPSEHGGPFNAHVSVMSPQEVESIGGPDKVKERGQRYAYALGRLKEVEPSGWSGVAKVWYVEVHSPELQALRRSYGLSSLPKGGESAFHVSCAVLRRGVLGRNEKSRAGVSNQEDDK